MTKVFYIGDQKGGRPMNVRNMEYLLMIAEKGNLSAAAKALGISQPTLSLFLSDLEDELGTHLFYREKKIMKATPAGMIYLDAAKRITAIRDQTYRTIHQLTHEPQIVLYVGATPLRGSIMFATVYNDFNRYFPNVKVEIKESYMKELKSLIRDESINFALGTCYDSDDPDLDYITVCKEEVVIGLPAFHRLARLGATYPGYPSRLMPLDVAQLSDMPFVLMSQGNTVRAISDNIFLKARMSPTIVFETNNNLVLNNMIRQGTGAGFLPHSAMTPEESDIVYFSINPSYFMHLALMTKKNKRLSKEERFLAYLVISYDKDNPRYLPGMNSLAMDIWNEFRPR